jgi:hypothetical protein
MAASETPSERARTHRNAGLTIDLPGAGKVTFEFTGDMFALTESQRNLVFGIREQLVNFAQEAEADTRGAIPIELGTGVQGVPKPAPRNGKTTAPAEATA